jgi:hypothetical protein
MAKEKAHKSGVSRYSFSLFLRKSEAMCNSFPLSSYGLPLPYLALQCIVFNRLKEIILVNSSIERVYR